MMTEPVTISQTDLRKLLSAASPDGTLLYLYLQSGNALETAEKELNMNREGRFARESCSLMRKKAPFRSRREPFLFTYPIPNYVTTRSSQVRCSTYTAPRSTLGIHWEAAVISGRMRPVPSKRACSRSFTQAAKSSPKGRA